MIIEENHVYNIAGTYDEMTKEQIYLLIKKYAININNICEELINSLSGQVANKIKQARQYSDTWKKYKDYKKEVNPLIDKAYALADEVTKCEEYKQKSKEIWDKHITKMNIPYSFWSHFIVNYNSVVLLDKVQYLKSHIIDLRNLEDIEEYKELICGWLRSYTDKSISDTKEIQRLILQRLNRYVLHEPWGDWTLHGILEAYIRYIYIYIYISIEI